MNEKKQTKKKKKTIYISPDWLIQHWILWQIQGVPCLKSKPAKYIMLRTWANTMDTHMSHLVDKSSNTYLIWTKNTQYPIYWFASKYASSMLSAKVLKA